MKVGDYCYIKGISRDYGIGKIAQLNSGYSSNGGELIDIQFKHSKHSVPKINVISSPDIIDLAEIGDVIKYKTDIGTVRVQDVHNSVVMAMIKSNEIEVLSIVTKEQFESMEYKLESEVN